MDRLVKRDFVLTPISVLSVCSCSNGTDTMQASLEGPRQREGLCSIAVSRDRVLER